MKIVVFNRSLLKTHRYLSNNT